MSLFQKAFLVLLWVFYLLIVYDLAHAEIWWTHPQMTCTDGDRTATWAPRGPKPIKTTGPSLHKWQLVIYPYGDWQTHSEFLQYFQTQTFHECTYTYTIPFTGGIYTAYTLAHPSYSMDPITYVTLTSTTNPDPDPDPDPDSDPNLVGGEYEDEFARIIARLDDVTHLLQGMGEAEISDPDHDPETWEIVDEPFGDLDTSVDIPEKSELDTSWQLLPVWMSMRTSSLVTDAPTAVSSCSFVLFSKPVHLVFDLTPYAGILAFLGNLTFFGCCIGGLFIALEAE